MRFFLIDGPTFLGSEEYQSVPQLPQEKGKLEYNLTSWYRCQVIKEENEIDLEVRQIKRYSTYIWREEWTCLIFQNLFLLYTLTLQNGQQVKSWKPLNRVRFYKGEAQCTS